MTLGAYCDLFHNKSKLAVVRIACAAAQQESAEILLRRVSSSRRTTFKNFRARCRWSRRATTTAHLLLVTDPLALRSARLPIVLALARCCFSTGVRSRAAELHRLFGRQIVLRMNVRYEAAIIDQRTASNGRMPPAVPASAAQRSRPSGNLGYYTPGFAGNEARDADIPRRLLIRARRSALAFSSRRVLPKRRPL